MKFNIKDADGNITNTIIANAEFVEANFENYELWTDPNPTPVEPTAAEVGRMWRDMELSSSDQAAQTPDWPNRDNILTYRAALRDWPAKNEDGEYINGFPDTRPEL